MRNFVIALFAVILLLPFWATQSYLQWKMHGVKREVKIILAQELPETELTHFYFDQTQREALDWKDDREFLHGGKMYDIVSMDTLGDIIHYTVWLDREETKLNTLLRQTLKDRWSRDTDQREKRIFLTEFSKKVFFTPFPAFHFSTARTQKSNFEHCIQPLTYPHSWPLMKPPTTSIDLALKTQLTKI